MLFRSRRIAGAGATEPREIRGEHSKAVFVRPNRGGIVDHAWATRPEPVQENNRRLAFGSPLAKREPARGY